MDEVTVVQKSQSGTRWSTITEICARIISPITNIILARLLTPEAFGVIATVTMVVSFADVFTDAGFQKYLIQHDFVSKKDFYQSSDVAFWTNIVISVSGWVIIFFFCDQIANLVGNEGLGNVIWVAALSLPLTSFSSIQIAHYRKEFKFKRLFYIRLASSCVPLLVTVPIAYFTRSYWALVIGTLASNVVNAVLLTVLSDWKPSFYYSFLKLKEMFSYSWWILLEAVVVWLTSYIGIFIVGFFLSTTEVGLYRTGMNTVNQIINLISAATSAPLFSALSKLKNDNIKFENFYLRYIRAIGVFIIPLGVGIFIYRGLVTQLLLGDQWTSIINFIGLWGLTSSLSLIWGTYCNGVYNAKGKPHLSVLSQVLHLAVLIPVIIIGCQINFDALCTMRSLARLELIVVQMIIMWIVVKIAPGKYMRQAIPAFICTGVMVVVGLLLQSVSENILWQIFSVIICIGVYFGVFALFFRRILVDSIQTVGFRFRIRKNVEEK